MTSMVITVISQLRLDHAVEVIYQKVKNLSYRKYIKVSIIGSVLNMGCPSSCGFRDAHIKIWNKVIIMFLK